ncbi:methyltransferase domain-containing protein [Nocardia asteroides NBRC 15531]|uniref:Methyltransferase n=2 Tax=Nocardia asteroides TaxID=1824 RepID=U5EF32_NOCAS|nr:methyltransferase domain-containing protein [Nocardia asteroides]TLF69033.1 methyltransferase domain-containing protein [Nocardia asteroides NBRC 15531]UGT48507.1 methyltransferase domain-containing protein [Nocardia asteroides]GAD85018.1 putative methyltransferase [Nocardia asteroides NBRC 15531]
MPGVKDRLLTTIATQLGNPHGTLGKGVAFFLNRGNRRAIAAAVDATGVAAGATVADIGFGGGVGLGLFLDRVGADGVVHGVEPSPDMLARARSGFAGQVAAGRLVLDAGSLTALPSADASLDAAITVNTIYFLDDLPAACAELARVLRPGGTAVVGIGDPDAMAKMPFTPYGFTLRPVAEVIAALASAGFTVEQRTLPNPPLPHHLLIARKS